MHHDEAAVNVNVWIVPEEDLTLPNATNTQGENGLIVYRVETDSQDRSEAETLVPVVEGLGKPATTLPSRLVMNVARFVSSAASTSAADSPGACDVTRANPGWSFFHSTAT